MLSSRSMVSRLVHILTRLQLQQPPGHATALLGRAYAAEKTLWTPLGASAVLVLSYRVTVFVMKGVDTDAFVLAP